MKKDIKDFMRNPRVKHFIYGFLAGLALTAISAGVLIVSDDEAETTQASEK